MVANGEPPFDTVNVQERLPAYEWLIVGPFGGGRVRTGGTTRFLRHGRGRGQRRGRPRWPRPARWSRQRAAESSRMTTLLPPVHIALVPESRLTADLFTWTAARQGDVPANLTPGQRAQQNGRY